MLSDYFYLSVRNLKNRGLRSLLTMLGIFLGIASMVSLISLGQGLQSSITGQFSSLDADKLIIQNSGTGFGPPGSTTVKKLNKNDVRLIESIQDVEFVIPRLIRVVKVEYNRKVVFGGVASLPQKDEDILIVYDAINAKIEKGKLIEEINKGKVLLGSNFAKEQNFGKEINIGNNLEIQGKEFEVIGILKKAGNLFIDDNIFLIEEDLKDILEIGDEIDLIVVQIKNKDNLESVAEDIKRKLRKDRNQKIGEEDFAVETPLQSVQSINNILNIINAVIISIAGISLFVGGIGIANTMFTSVLERRKEIGIMKAVGAQNKNIVIIFLIESGLLGLIGGIIGVLMGFGLAFGVSIATSSFLGGIDLKVAISYPLIIFSLIFSLLIGVVFGVVPALQASKLNPVEALRR